MFIFIIICVLVVGIAFLVWLLTFRNNVIEYQEKKIAICSRGDQLNWVLTNITTYIELDVVVVTSRNYATFDKEVRNVYNPIVFNKQKSDYTALTKFVQDVVKEILKR